MRIVYLGTPDFAVLPLERIIESGREVVGVITNKDKPVGRKRIMTAPPVKTVAAKRGKIVFGLDESYIYDTDITGRSFNPFITLVYWRHNNLTRGIYFNQQTDFSQQNLL